MLTLLALASLLLALPAPAVVEAQDTAPLDLMVTAVSSPPAIATAAPEACAPPGVPPKPFQIPCATNSTEPPFKNATGILPLPGSQTAIPSTNHGGQGDGSGSGDDDDDDDNSISTVVGSLAPPIPPAGAQVPQPGLLAPVNVPEPAPVAPVPIPVPPAGGEVPESAPPAPVPVPAAGSKPDVVASPLLSPSPSLHISDEEQSRTSASSSSSASASASAINSSIASTSTSDITSTIASTSGSISASASASTSTGGLVQRQSPDDPNSCEITQNYSVFPIDGTDEIKAAAALRSISAVTGAAVDPVQAKGFGIALWSIALTQRQALELLADPYISAVIKDCTSNCQDPLIKLAMQRNADNSLITIGQSPNTAFEWYQQNYIFDEKAGIDVNVYIIDSGANLRHPVSGIPPILLPPILPPIAARLTGSMD